MERSAAAQHLNQQTARNGPTESAEEKGGMSEMPGKSQEVSATCWRLADLPVAMMGMMPGKFGAAQAMFLKKPRSRMTAGRARLLQTVYMADDCTRAAATRIMTAETLVLWPVASCTS